MIFNLIGIALLAVGVLVFFIRRRSAELQAASVNWPTADGRITDAKLHSWRDTNSKRLNYMARVWFGYQVDGVDYTSEKISWGGRPYSPISAEAEKTLAKYPVGSGVRVYYNPQKPKQSVLEPSEKGGLAVMTWIMVTFAIMGAVFFVVGFFI